MATTRGSWMALALVLLVPSRSARADVPTAALLSPEPLVWVDNCPFNPRHPHALRCFSKRLVPASSRAARALAPFDPPPDAGGLDASADIVACDGQIATASGVSPVGLAPSDFASAYGVPAAPGGAGKIIAVVDACASTTVLSDLAAYRAQFQLGALPTCGGAPGTPPTRGAAPCIGVVSERGDGTLPPADSSWAPEISLDVEMVSALCPACSILLVEADTPNEWDVGPAVNEAVTLGANAVTNSYGAAEDPDDPFGPLYSDGPYAADFTHDGVLVAAASGDDRYDNEYDDDGAPLAPNFPASVAAVLSVGGTVLTAGSGAARGGFTESLWAGTTSGCSTEFAKPAYQAGLSMGSCGMRGTVDVAAAAEQVASYAGGGWLTQNGTSCSTPVVTALLVRVGLETQPNAFFYAHAEAFYDVTTGNNDPSGTCNDVMCNAGVGWDGPTGWGSPNATALRALAPPPDAGNDGGGADAAGGAGVDATAPLDASADTPIDASGVDDAEPIVDATSPGADGGLDRAPPPRGGCSCRTAGAHRFDPTPSALPLVAFAALAVRARRRITRRRATL